MNRTKTIYILVALCLMSCCKKKRAIISKKELKTKTERKIENIIQNDTMKTFDIERFNTRKNHMRQANFITKDGTVIEQTEFQFDFYETVKPKNSYFQTRNFYYKNGILKSTVQYFNPRFFKGIKKEYDEEANLIKETNYDDPYKFTWEDILLFIKNKKIDMTHYLFEIRRGVVDNKPLWLIIFNLDSKKQILGVLQIDGITGKILIVDQEDYPSEE